MQMEAPDQTVPIKQFDQDLQWLHRPDQSLPILIVLGYAAFKLNIQTESCILVRLLSMMGHNLCFKGEIWKSVP